MRTILFVLFFSQVVLAEGIMQKLESLGGDKELVRKARELDHDNKIRVVQKRAVDRTWRLEMGVSYGTLSGGHPYLSTQDLGGNLDVHINPMWSIGARYNSYYNELTPEGRRVYTEAENQALQTGQHVEPQVDYPIRSQLAVLSFYPMYGKLSLFDHGIAQFDLYMLGGYGQVQLSSGSAPTWTAGGGIGIWMSQHFTSRLEVRYQNYQSRIYSGLREENQVLANFSLGFLL